MPKEPVVTFVSHDPPIRASALLGVGIVELSGGFGGWNKIHRPKRSEIVEWGGRPLIEMSIPLLLDKEQGGIENDLRRFGRLATPPDNQTDPPIVKVKGSVPHTDLSYIITRIRWGKALYRKNGNRYQQHFTVSLLEYSVGENFALSPSDRARTTLNISGRRGSQRIYVAVNGDTFSSIAARVLGRQSRWIEIAALNPDYRDPRLRIPPGTRLQMPQ